MTAILCGRCGHHTSQAASLAGCTSRKPIPFCDFAPHLCLFLQATFERGLTFNEFLRVVMGEPPKQVRLKDVALTVSSILGAGGAGGLLAKMKAKQQQVQATPAAASSAIEEQMSIV
jgi:hypothetical protein